MNASADTHAGLLLVIGGFLLFISLVVYGGIVRNIAAVGGKVRTEKFGKLDLVLAGALILWFLDLTISGFESGPQPVRDENIVTGGLVYLILVAAIAVFMRYRGMNVIEEFGIRLMRPGATLGTSLGLIFAAYPLIECASVLTQAVLGPEAKMQEPVKYFVTASQKMNYPALVAMGVVAVIIAPLAEEFIFRGYIHGVLKRNFGLVAGLLVNASVFAAMHLNEASLPALFLLAVCFTIAYETTGSILVCMCMHAVFNLTSLLFTFYAAHHSLL